MESNTSAIARPLRGRRDETRDCFGEPAALSAPSEMGSGGGAVR
jgi:hypothetical protein